MAFGYSNDNFLHEAFKDMDAINEEVFDISQDGDKKLKAFLEGDVLDDTQEVVDKEAPTEDDLQDSYLGKVILDCCVCHTLLYKDKNDVVLDDTEEYANVGEECPFCRNEEGFKIVGEVTEFDADDDDEKDEKDDKGEKENDEANPTIGDDEGPVVVKEKEKVEVEESLNEGNGRDIKAERALAVVPRLIDKVVALAGDAEDPYKLLGDCGLSDSEIDMYIGEYDAESDPTSDYYDGDESLKESKASEVVRDEIDAEADDKKEAAKKALDKAEDDADADKDYRLKKGITRTNESVEEVKVVTDKEEVGVKTDEEGKVTVETSPRKEESGETIEPISDEVKADIEAGSAEDEIAGEIGDEVEVDIDDFDEESFDELGEAFLKKSYSNVEGYRTTSATATGNKLVIEGVIKFKSGNEKPTSFILESRDITKSGRSRFIGENRQLCNAKKAFSVRGQIKEGRFISESLNYDYRARDAKTGNPKRISGTVTVSK